MLDVVREQAELLEEGPLSIELARMFMIPLSFQKPLSNNDTGSYWETAMLNAEMGNLGKVREWIPSAA